jgi:hypothetical protein
LFISFLERMQVSASDRLFGEEVNVRVHPRGGPEIFPSADRWLEKKADEPEPSRPDQNTNKLP